MSELFETLPLLSVDEKSELACHVVADVDMNGQRFVLLTPVKTFITVVRDDEDGIVELDAAEGAFLLDTFNEELKKHNVSLLAQDGEFVLDGELDDELLELCDSIGVADEDDDETYLILADAEKDDKQYLLLSPETPTMFPAKVKDGKAYPLSDAELEKVESQLEQALENSIN